MNGKCLIVLFWLSLVLIFMGADFAKMFHTDSGKVKITEIQFTPEDGGLIHAFLYVPKGVTPENKAPAVVAAHGYNNTLELQGLNAIELSRRGFVVISLDHYGHGKSTFPDPNINKGIVADIGAYAALQYLKNLPYVDLTRVGMVGHSMGGGSIQSAALRAWNNRFNGMSDVVVPTAVLPTSQSFTMDAENNFVLAQFPINVGVVFGQYDEWANPMWGVPKGSMINEAARTPVVFGFEKPEYGKYYTFGNSSPLLREDAVAAARNYQLRVMYQPVIDHPHMHMSSDAAGFITDFFSVTLADGAMPLPPENQRWFYKEISTGIAFIGYFIFIVTFGLILLRSPYFKTIVRTEPVSPSNPKDGKGWLVYIAIYVLCLLPAPLFYNLLVGYPIAIKATGRVIPTLMPLSSVFPMPTANGLVLFNLLIGTIMLIVFILTYKLYMKKNGVTMANLGVKLPFSQILKALLLAFTVFAAGYLLLAIVFGLFMVDFRFYTFSIKVLTASKIHMFFVYLPFWVYAFVISSLTLNSFTRIEGISEWKNIPLMMFAAVGGLLVFFLIDYGVMTATGVKMWTLVPYPANPPTTSALASVLLWGLLVILPISAVISRVFFKLTGSIWVGGFVNAFVITFYAISNTVVGAGLL